MNNKAMSPLAATFILLAFAIFIGILVMNWSETYIQRMAADSEISPASTQEAFAESPLEIVKARLAKGEISLEEYQKIVEHLS